jgi:hypothetical protein
MEIHLDKKFFETRLIKNAFFFISYEPFLHIEKIYPNWNFSTLYHFTYVENS